MIIIALLSVGDYFLYAPANAGLVTNENNYYENNWHVEENNMGNFQELQNRIIIYNIAK